MRKSSGVETPGFIDVGPTFVEATTVEVSVWFDILK